MHKPAITDYDCDTYVSGTSSCYIAATYGIKGEKYTHKRLELPYRHSVGYTSLPDLSIQLKHFSCLHMYL